MDILVLLKQVPDTESIIVIDDDGKSIKTADLKWIINPYDEFAVEEAIRIRNKLGIISQVRRCGDNLNISPVSRILKFD